ncbi:MAG: class A beta-lactamase-related serine hydrolase [Rhodobacteraceae bacterium]|nr:class A beta-lactamase-related serine hydrolase [Paracoccaceae bacterium]
MVHMQGYGLADIASKRPVTPDSIFDLASLSKEMTAFAARLQMEDGLYTPDTPVARLLPVFAGADWPRPLVVADLVHHISGLTDYLSGDDDLDYGPRTPNDQVLAWLADQPLDRAPGTAFDYSNSGYLTLGSLVAAADDEDDLAAVLQARIWGPLGMENTSLITPADPDLRVTPYDGTAGQFHRNFEPTVTQGDGNVMTSLRDLAVYEAALSGVGDAAFDPDLVASLFENGHLDNGDPVADPDGGEGYGYGWFLTADDAGNRFAEHTGSWTGTSTLYRRNLTTGVTVILLANGEQADLYGPAYAIDDAMGQQ